MTYTVFRALLQFEDNSRKAISFDQEVKDLPGFKKDLLEKTKAKEIFLYYEYEDKPENTSNLSFKHIINSKLSTNQ